MSESRKFPRAHSRLRCWCEGDNVTFYARVGNLSEGGLFLRTSTPLETGVQARLRLEVGVATFDAVATVVWSRGEGEVGPPGMGLKFDDVGAGGTERLRREILGRTGDPGQRGEGGQA